jgi:Nanos RNA binding domain
MSRNNKITSPFCKVCRDAGKLENEFTSHYVKDSEGKVCCPYLLGLECRYCTKKGHTPSCCPILKDNEKKRIKNEKNASYQQQEQAKRQIQGQLVLHGKKSSKFADAFGSDNDSSSSSDDEKVVVVAEEKYPALNQKTDQFGRMIRAQTTDKYGRIIRQPQVVEDKQSFMMALLNPTPIKPEPVPVIEVKVTPFSFTKTKKITSSWADLSDSDSD